MWLNQTEDGIKYDKKATQMFTSIITSLDKEADPFHIPPKLHQLENYRKATSTGYVQNPDAEREPFSYLFYTNKKFSIWDSSNRFAQMGPGYTTFFFYSKAVIFMTLFPIFFLSLFSIYLNTIGGTCQTIEKLQELQSKVNSSANVQIIEQTLPESYILENIQSLNNSKLLEPALQFYVDTYCLQASCPSCFENKMDLPECKRQMMDFYVQYSVSNICLRDTVTTSSFANRMFTAYSAWYDVLDFLLLFLFFTIVCITTYLHEKKALEFDGENNTVDDYTVLLKGLGAVKHIPRLNQEIDKMFKRHGFEVKNINFCFNTQAYVDLQQKYIEQMRILVKAEYQKHKALAEKRDVQRFQAGGSLMEKAENARYEVETTFQAINDKFAEYSNGCNQPDFLGSAYVSFNTQQHKISALSLFRRKGFLYEKLGIGPTRTVLNLNLEVDTEKHRLWLDQATFPQNIIWYNLGYSRLNRFFRFLLVIFLSIIIIALDFYLILALTIFIQGKSGIRKVDESISAFYQIFVSSLISLTVFLVDFLLQYVLYYLIIYQKDVTYTNQEFELTVYTWKIQFVASALVVAAAATFKLNIYGTNGLVYTLNSIFISYLVLPPFFLIYGNIWVYLGKYKRSKIEKFIQGEIEEPVVTQEEANEAWLKPAFSLNYYFTFVIRSLAFLMFFLPIFPIGAFYSIVTQIVMYWGHKWVLVNRSNKLKSYTTLISELLIKELEWCMLSFVLGLIFRDNIYRLANLRDLKIRAIYVIYLCLIVISYIFELKNVVRDVLPDLAYNDDTYEVTMKKNPNHYNIANPATFKNINATTNLLNPMEKVFVPIMPLHKMYKDDVDDDKSEEKLMENEDDDSEERREVINANVFESIRYNRLEEV